MSLSKVGTKPLDMDGYEVIREGLIKKGDLIWSPSTFVFTNVAPAQVGQSVKNSTLLPVIRRKPKK